MRNFIRTATTQKYIALICVPLMLVAFGGWSCTVKQQQTIVQYVGIAVNGCSAVAVIEPGIASVCAALGVANAGLSAWKAGSPVPQNVIDALQAALAKAEIEYNISTKAKELIEIVIVAVETALTISGVATVSRIKSSQYAGMTPQQLRKKFNQLAPAAGANAI